MARTSLSLIELVSSLKRELRLLELYHTQAFTKCNDDFLGEVAGKLRLLASDRGRNKPLLITLMKAFNYSHSFVLDGPPIKPAPGEKGPGDRITFEEYLNGLGFTELDPATKQLRRVSVIDFVANYANQLGSAHQDDAVDLGSLGCSYLTHMFGINILRQKLQNTSGIVITAGRKFGHFLTPERIDEQFVAEELPEKPGHGHFAERAAALLRLGRTPEALECCAEGLDLFPYSAELKLHRALACSTSAQFELALSIYDELVSSGIVATASPRLIFLAYYNRACMQLKAGQVDGCLASLQYAGLIGDLSLAAQDSELALLRYDPAHQDQFDRIIALSSGKPNMDASVLK